LVLYGRLTLKNEVIQHSSQIGLSRLPFVDLPRIPHRGITLLKKRLLKEIIISLSVEVRVVINALT
jgi:hypothetical protein